MEAPDLALALLPGHRAIQTDEVQPRLLQQLLLDLTERTLTASLLGGAAWETFVFAEMRKVVLLLPCAFSHSPAPPSHPLSTPAYHGSANSLTLHAARTPEPVTI